jgi:signal transduction histidine kinase
VGVIKGSMGVCTSALEIITHELENAHRIEDLRENESLARALDTLRSSIDVTSSSGQRIEKIVKNLKNFTRLDQAALQSTDIHEGIESTLALLTPQWGERVRVVRRFSDLPKIRCYSSALNQLFMTLLVNAREAIEGDGTITITTENGDGGVRISISDDGGGIDPERLERIFEIGFSRKGNRMRMHTGLANVYGIVKKHNGHIDVRSEPTRGTTFAITLPVSARD